MRLRIPLAWLQLIHNRIRFVAAIAGIAFVVVLILVQIGFQDALFESAVGVHKSLQGDLFLTSYQYKSLTAHQGFPRIRLYQSLAVEEVAAVTPLYFQFGKLKNLENGQKSSIFVFGIDPGLITFNLPDINRHLDRLKISDVALFDRNSRPEFGLIAKKFERGQAVQIEISAYNEIVLAYRLKIGGLFSIGASFGVDGNLIVNSSSLIHIFNKKKDEIDIGLITLNSPSDLQKVIAKLNNILPKDVKVLSRQQFIKFEKTYWDSRTPIGFIFKLLVTMAFTVGIGISYQVLYSNISSQLTQYATLKAIGYSDRYLFGIVFQQSLILAILGYIPGVMVSYGIYNLASQETHLPVIMTINKGVTVLIAIVLMCVFSGILASQKLRYADPADII
ncbi:MAG: ABC transporter permease DevC [Microcoleus sp.]